MASRISDLGEFGFLEKLLANLHFSDDRVKVAVGDDASVLDLKTNSLTVLTTDMLIESIHFRLDWQEPEEIGHKAVAANLSDVAAMGGCPEWLLVSLGCPPEMEESFLMSLYRGIFTLCEEADVKVIGGDTTRADRLILGITALGRCEEGSPVTLGGARPGERIYTTGCPGLSGLGLQLLEEFGRQDVPSGYEEAIRAHLCPTVPWRQAPEIARFIRPGAMTDLSDGLARDLGKICRASSVGARIDFCGLSWHKEMIKAREDFLVNPDWDLPRLALSGGEDYCLLFTADQNRLKEGRKKSRLLASMPLFELGEIRPAESGFVALGTDGVETVIDPQGFDHFFLG